MSLYAHLNKLRSDGTHLMLLEERISGGKNDYDVGVSEEKIQETMDQLGWDDEAKNKKRGFIGEGRQKVDIMVRKELPHLPWETAEINGETFFVQSPEELIFEKMSGLIDPGRN